MDGSNISNITSVDILEAVRDTALLADVNISVWAAEKSDTELMNEIKTQAGATGNVGRAVKNILAGHDGLLKECRSAYGAVRTTHYQITLPWVADPHAERVRGPRLLPNALFDRYLSAMSTRKREAEMALDKFLADYPDACERAKKNLGRLAPRIYPSPAFVRAAFGVNLQWEPIPAGAQFKNLPDNILQKLSSKLNARQHAMIETSQKIMWTQVRDRVMHFHEIMKDPGARFKMSTVENVRELITLLPGWNVAGHEGANEIARDIELMLEDVDADKIRDDAELRTDMMRASTNIITKLNKWGV